MSVSSEPALVVVPNSPEQKWTNERVLSIRYWTPTLLSIRTTRYSGLSFKAGQFTRIGFVVGPKTVWRAYSVVSSPNDDYLEFLVIIVEAGDCSQQFGTMQVGDELPIDKSSFGYLTTDQLAPGQDLWLIASGTGLGPFISVLRERDTWQNYSRLIVAHSVRRADELAYRDEINALPNDPLFAGSPAQLCYLPIVTRQLGASALTERIPQLLQDGRLEEAAGVALTLANSRVMVCGNPDMASEVRQFLSNRGFLSTRKGVLGQMAFEKYW